jgi:hypothetical protein
VNLETFNEEEDCGIVKEKGPRRIVVSFELDNVFVSGVLIVQLLRVVGQDEVVLESSRKHGWNKAFFDMFNWR